MSGYQRTDTEDSIANGNVINANALDAEFNAMAAAMVSSTGHTHGGAAGEGAPITKLGPVQDLTISASTLAPKLPTTMNLGSEFFDFNDLFLGGVGYIDRIVASPSTLALPSYTFREQAGTGFSYNLGTESIHVTFGGISALGISNTAITSGTNVPFVGELVIPNEIASSLSDISKHLTLSSPGYGLNITANRLGIIAGPNASIGFNFDEFSLDRVSFSFDEATIKTAHGISIQTSGSRKLTFRNFAAEEVGMLFSETSNNNITLRRRVNDVTQAALELKANGDISAAVGQFEGNGSALTALSASNVSSGTLPVARLGVTSGDTNWVLSRIADAATGSVGSYAMLCQATAGTAGSNIAAGDILAGSGLRYFGLIFSALNTPAESGGSFGAAVPGSWQAHGTVNDGQSVMRTTLFKRIS